MNKIQANIEGAAAARVSQKASRKATILTNGKEKENKEDEVKNNVKTKGLKRCSSDNEVCTTRKRSAFGDITNAIQSHANRIAMGRKKEKCHVPKPPKATQLKRSTKRFKSSKSSGSLPAFKVCVEDAIGEQQQQQQRVEKESVLTEEECADILLGSTSSSNDDKSEDQHETCSSVSSEEAEVVENEENDNILPSGVVPYDLDEDPDHICEYAHSIFKNMRIRETRYPVADYLAHEGRLTTGIMRAILVDWLVEVQENFQLYHETLYVAVKLIDCYLQDHDTPKELLQLVGAAALLIACKVEERQPPPVDDFQYICDDAYTSKMFIAMEIKILKALDFDINIPISYRYLRRFARVTSMGMEILTLARYILELSLQPATFVHQPSSKIAAACLCLSMKMVGPGVWDANHCFHSGYTETEVTELMVQLNEMLVDADESKLKTVRTKYSHPIHFSVAKTKPLSSNVFSLRC